MKKVLRTVALFCLLMLLLIATVSCSNILDGLFGGNEEGTTPEATTSKVTTPEVTTPEVTTPEVTTPEETTPEVTTPEETTQPHVHAFGEWITVQKATCTEKGQQVRTCACGEKEIQEIGTLGHTEVADAAVANTCTTDGLTAGSHCFVCNEVFVAQEVVPAAHDWVRLELLKSETCFSYGEERRCCQTCGAVENAPVSPYAHELVKDEETQLHTCSLCNGVVFAGHLYIVFEGEYHWFDAYELCEEMGGHLATITSEREQAVITELMSLETRTMSSYWIGGIRLTDGFHWITGEPFEYTNWKSGQPNFARENQYFIRVETSLLAAVEEPGRWNDDDYQYKYGFVCEFKLDVTECEHIFTEWETAVEPTCWTDGEQYRICTYCGVEETEVLAKLEHNFVLNEESGIEICEHCNAAKYDGRIYALFTEEVDWFDAYSRCEALGGHLATITSEEEHSFIVSYLNVLNLSVLPYVGGYSDGEQWHWVTSETFEYTNWKSGEPSGNPEWVMHIGYRDTVWYKWNDLRPSDLYPYLCEFECEE